jgi:hypothetical protein
MISPFKTLVASALVLAGHAGAALYQQNFTTDDTANWAMKSGPTTPVPVDAAANFFFDYSIVGIPSAPNGTGTTGMKLQANLSAGVFGGMSVSPTNVSLPSVYTLTFDWWSNSVGPFPAGGSGSTNLSTFGVGTTGANAQWPGGAVDSVYFGATGDGGSSSDVRAYSSAAPSSYADANPVYLGATTRNNTNAFYSSFGSGAPPSAQTTLYPGQTGNVAAGAMAFAWHQVTIDFTASVIDWTVDGKKLASVDRSTVTIGGTNIFFGHSDINNGSSSDANDTALLFTLIDNIKVEAIPEPGAMGLTTLAVLGLLSRRRRA